MSCDSNGYGASRTCDFFFFFFFAWSRSTDTMHADPLFLPMTHYGGDSLSQAVAQ